MENPNQNIFSNVNTSNNNGANPNFSPNPAPAVNPQGVNQPNQQPAVNTAQYSAPQPSSTVSPAQNFAPQPPNTQNIPIGQNPSNINPGYQQNFPPHQPQQQPSQQYAAQSAMPTTNQQQYAAQSAMPSSNPQPGAFIQNSPNYRNAYATGQIPPNGRPLNQAYPNSRPTAKAPDPRKAIWGCLGFFIFAIIAFVIFVLVFVSQTSANGDNSLASTLGVNAAEFTNALILLTNIIFGIVVFVAFFVAVIGFFQAVLVPKTDKPTKSRWMRSGITASIIMLFFLAIWVFVFIFLSGKQVNISTPETTTAQILTEPENTLQQTAPFSVVFDSSAIQKSTPRNFEILTYQWDFGDGETSTAPQVTHIYTTTGRFTAKLTVTARNTETQEDASQTFTKDITIANAKLNASFTATPESGRAPLKVVFDASASSSPAGKILSYDWDFTGSNTFKDASGVKAEHTFDKVGDYQVALRITDNTGQEPAITEKTITVSGTDTPTAVIDIPTSTGKYFSNKQITFLGEKSTSPTTDIVKYEWDFGDGTPKATTRTATHTYERPGLYEVSLTVTDRDGLTGQATQKITLETEESAPVASIDTTPKLTGTAKSLSGTAPFEVSFSAAGSTDPDNNIVDFQWDFDGDGKMEATGETAKYVFTEPGVYNATLYVTDSAKNQSKSVLVINVSQQGLQARVTADVVEGNSPLTVTFDASGSSAPGTKINTYEWDFGDGSPRRIGTAQISYKYTSIGNFTAKVTARSADGQSSTAEIIISIRPVELSACFTPSVESGIAPLSVEFDPRCTQGPAAIFKYDFGDGETSRTRKPTHTFDKPGNYTVTLEVTDNQNIVNVFKKDILVLGEIK